MVLPKLPSPVPFEGSVFRNIATIKTSQELFDDIAGNAGDIPILQILADETSGIDHSLDAKNRAFQYCDPEESLSVFDEDRWYVARFSDGTFGVWYGALEKDTSIIEALFWHYRNVYKPMLSKANGPINVDRRMLEAKVKTSSAIDLRKLTADMAELTHDTDYTFCQALGAHAVENKIDLYLTPSTRKPKGTCVPVFSPISILETKTLFYLHFEIRADGNVRITTDHDESMLIPEGW
jgi:hypothetical protein